MCLLIANKKTNNYKNNLIHYKTLLYACEYYKIINVFSANITVNSGGLQMHYFPKEIKKYVIKINTYFVYVYNKIFC